MKKKKESSEIFLPEKKVKETSNNNQNENKYVTSISLTAIVEKCGISIFRPFLNLMQLTGKMQ